MSSNTKGLLVLAVTFGAGYWLGKRMALKKGG